MQRPYFNGQCIKCGQKNSREGARKTLRLKFEGKKRLDSHGYVVLARSAIPVEDLPLADAMRKKASFVSEHRLVVAKMLGRPLRSTECVDNIDGNKQNNRPSNLRLYRMGNNDPGHMPGHGTYYHEWQMALARIKELESR